VNENHFFELLYTSSESDLCTALAASEPTYLIVNILDYSVIIVLFQAVEPHNNKWIDRLIELAYIK
ncbi:8867_t:CDS:1, partial [Racocetra fulgida]